VSSFSFSLHPLTHFLHWPPLVIFQVTFGLSALDQYRPIGLSACLERPADSQEGDVIKGELSCAPNSRNNRDLDIVFDYQIEGSNDTKGQMVYKMYVHLARLGGCIVGTN
jgi:hypothetical protein